LLDSPNDYELPFHEPKSASRLSWALCARVVSFCQLRLLRSFYLLCKSVHNRAELPRYDWSLLSWVSFPLQFSLSTPLSLEPVRTRRFQHCFHPKDQLATEGILQPLLPGKDLTNTMN
jgi:hypothetical protein